MNNTYDLKAKIDSTLQYAADILKDEVAKLLKYDAKYLTGKDYFINYLKDKTFSMQADIDKLNYFTLLIASPRDRKSIAKDFIDTSGFDPVANYDENDYLINKVANLIQNKVTENQHLDFHIAPLAIFVDYLEELIQNYLIEENEYYDPGSMDEAATIKGWLTHMLENDDSISALAIDFLDEWELTKYNPNLRTDTAPIEESVLTEAIVNYDDDDLLFICQWYFNKPKTLLDDFTKEDMTKALLGWHRRNGTSNPSKYEKETYFGEDRRTSIDDLHRSKYLDDVVQRHPPKRKRNYDMSDYITTFKNHSKDDLLFIYQWYFNKPDFNIADFSDEEKDIALKAWVEKYGASRLSDSGKNNYFKSGKKVIGRVTTEATITEDYYGYEDGEDTYDYEEDFEERIEDKPLEGSTDEIMSFVDLYFEDDDDIYIYERDFGITIEFSSQYGGATEYLVSGPKENVDRYFSYVGIEDYDYEFVEHQLDISVDDDYIN